ncbi:RICIN domain-containing protein [Streptomyces sp. YS415]|uniref:RICIN domain-containing protein n=1 Tax=Streptomyces sp. YS415 TaxID=2944806 RepID=UPI00201FED24|nr:RICIN domain-containing protein [Streptomyces sp. YS415]MCL7429405.1 RICIN domain-containing protein [Streptomyces sp. YS415]
MLTRPTTGDTRTRIRVAVLTGTALVVGLTAGGLLLQDDGNTPPERVQAVGADAPAPDPAKTDASYDVLDAPPPLSKEELESRKQKEKEKEEKETESRKQGKPNQHRESKKLPLTDGHPNDDALQDTIPGVEGTPTNNWLEVQHRLTNVATGKCLTAGAPGSRKLAQNACDDSPWRFEETGRPGRFLMKERTSGQCLDTNGKVLYLSGCTAQDEGQHWRVSTRLETCDVYIRSGAFDQRYLSGWLDGTLTVAPLAEIDDHAKRAWKSPTITRC